MKIGFVETMRGTLTHRDGTRTPIEFEVHAHAARLRRFLSDGKTELTGILRADPFAREAPARGTLVVDLPRSMTYAIDFEAGGARFHLSGLKTISVLRPVRSTTEMEVVLTRNGEEVARGQMAIALSTLPAFFASWLPFHTQPRINLAVRRRLLERTALDAAT